MTPPVPTPIGPALPGTKQVLLTFNEALMRPRSSGARTIDTYVEQVSLPFLPKGLLLWGATEDTFVHCVKVGNTNEVEIGGYAPIPGRYFTTGRTFADIERLADAGELELAIEARQQLEMREAAVGVQIVVALSGPYDRFVLWGLTYSRYEGPHRKAMVERVGDSAMYAGRLDEVRLAGVQTLLDVTAPDARIAAELLIGLSQGRH